MRRGKTGEWPMTTETKKRQLVIATFSDPGAFSASVSNLLQSGISVDQMCFAARATVLGKISLHDAALDAALQALTSTLDLQDNKVAVSAQERIHGLCGHTATPILDDRPPSCIPRDLVEHIHEGAIVFAVSPATADQQRMCIRILLRHSSQHVETREVRGSRTQPCDHREMSSA
jgi:hypothetical protein